MEIEVSDPDLVEDLISFLRRARYQAEAREYGTLAVEAPASVPEGLARLSLEESLAAWQARHPGVRVRRRPAHDL